MTMSNIKSILFILWVSSTFIEFTNTSVIYKTFGEKYKELIIINKYSY